MSTTSQANKERIENPLEPSVAHEQRVRERAYHLWESEGCLDGKSDEYWERARELEAMMDSAGAGLLPIDQPVRIDEAELEENLGEFPERAVDQGERRSTPAAKKSRRESRDSV